MATAMSGEGWQGWDAYARFYDWENAQTVRRRDVGFWRRLAAAAEPQQTGEAGDELTQSGHRRSC